MTVLHSRPPAYRAAPVDLNGPGHYLNWGVIHISVANVVVIGAMLAVFVLAVVLQMPAHKRHGAGRHDADPPSANDHAGHGDS